MSHRYVITMLVALTLASHPLMAQVEENPLDIFGYFQVAFDQSHEEITAAMMKTQVKTRNTFLVNQLNILGAKRFTSSLSCFVNLEITNNYSSDRNWGAFNLSEAWVKYEHSDALNIKAGLMIPAFNNLHEIKNRTPLLPYIVRPLVYEATANEILNSYGFLPENGYLQVYGFLPAAGVKIDYAAYIGNSESSWINSSNGSFYTIRGLDTTMFKMVGGRVGVRTGRFKAGFSVTGDKENLVKIGLGAVHRMRYGGDLSFQVSGFSFESEIISVREPLTPEKQQRLDFIAMMNPRQGLTLDKIFYYGNLAYDFTDKMYGYVGYQYVNNSVGSTRTTSFEAYTFGAGFRPLESMVLKAQYWQLKGTNLPLYEFIMRRVQLAVSVVF